MALMALAVTILVAGSVLAATVPTWRVGNTWNYEEQIFVTGDAFPDGWAYLTDWQRWSVESYGNRTQGASGLAHDCYDLTLAAGGPPAILSGWYKSGTRLRTTGGRLRQAECEAWWRRSDLSYVHRRRYLTGALQAITGSNYGSMGNFALNENWEFNPPLEIYDFPTYVGEIWNNDGGSPGAFIAINTWGTYNAGTYGGDGDWNEGGSLGGIATHWASGVTAPVTSIANTQWMEVLGTLTFGSTVADADYNYYYLDAARNYVEHTYVNERMGSDFTFKDAIHIGQSYSLVADPAITLTVNPTTAAVGDTVNFSGTGAAAGNVAIENPPNGWTTNTTASGGNYSANVTVPYVTDLSTTDYDLASIGLIATDSAGAYIVSTLTVTGTAIVDDDDPGDFDTPGDLANWANPQVLDVDDTNCPAGPFPADISVDVRDQSDDGAGNPSPGVAQGLKVTTAQYLRSDDGGSTYVSDKDVAIYAGIDAPAFPGWIGATQARAIATTVRSNLSGRFASVQWFSWDASDTGAPDGDRNAFATWLANNQTDGEDDICLIVDANVYVAYAGADSGALERFIESGNTVMHTGDHAFYYYVDSAGASQNVGSGGGADILDIAGLNQGQSGGQFPSDAGIELIPSGPTSYSSSRSSPRGAFLGAGWEVDAEFYGNTSNSDMICYRNTTHGGRYIHALHGPSGYGYNPAAYTEIIQNWAGYMREGVAMPGASDGDADVFRTINITDANFTTQNANNGVTVMIRDMADPITVGGPVGFQPDYGLLFHALRGYGWDGTYTDDTRKRNSSMSPQDDTFLFSPGDATNPAPTRNWDLAVDNGNYDVTVAYGDATNAQGPHRILLEGTVLVNNDTTAAGEVKTATRTGVSISDGIVDIAIGNAGGNTMINWVEVDGPTPDGTVDYAINFQAAGEFRQEGTGYNIGEYDITVNTSVCGAPTPTATSTVQPPTSTMTATAIPTDTATATAIPTDTATATAIPTDTATATAIPTDTATATIQATATATSTNPPTTPTEVPTPIITNINRAKVPLSPDVDVTWSTVATYTYELYYSDAFPPTWNLLSTQVATGATDSYTDLAMTAERYYGVRIQGGAWAPNEVGVLPIVVNGLTAPEPVQLAMCATSLDPMSGTTIQDVIGQQMFGTTAQGTADEIWKWDDAGQTYQQNWLFGFPSHPLDGQWLLGGGASSMPLVNGDGFWARRKQTTAATLLTDGEVRRSPEPVHTILPPGANPVALHMKGVGLGVSIPLDEANTTLVADGANGTTAQGTADEIWAWDQAADGYRQCWLFGFPSHPLDGQWLEGGGATTLTLDPGMGIWYRSKGAGFDWGIPVPY